MYIDVILPLYIQQLFTYKVPLNLQSDIMVGMRVSVTIGKNKIYSAIVYNIRNTPPDNNSTYREINNILDSSAIVTETQLRLWEWISDYYMCTLGEVMKCFLPKALKLEARINESNKIEYEKSVSIIKVKYILPLNNSSSEIEPLLSRSKKQLEAYNIINKLYLNNPNGIPYKELLKLEIKQEIIRALEKRELIRIESREEQSSYSKADLTTILLPDLPELNASQKTAINQLKELSQNNRPTLLYGIPGSGKTEISLHLIKEVLEAGQSALILIPEIALTTHLTERVRSYFGERTIIYTSLQTDLSRQQSYLKILKGESKVIVGTRVAIGLPFCNLGTVIVDEEHDSSYKQNEPTPRFNARDSAIILAKTAGISTILVSSTPSIESYYNALNGKYNLVKISENFIQKSSGKITIIDKRDIDKANKKDPYKRYFSKYLLSRIEQQITENNQTILFKNSRGFASYIECGSCGYIPRCQQCNITLNYHAYNQSMLCHICGNSYQKETSCAICGSKELILRGYGTENLEEKIKDILPTIRTIRIDGDSVKSKKFITEALENIEKKKIDLLVGTQIICKGFDFNHVTLVAVTDAEAMLNLTNFRSEERGFQTFMQLFGRTTRSIKKGEMIIQTSRPDSTIIKHIRENNYEGMYIDEIKARGDFGYPPFVRLIDIIIRHKDKQSLKIAVNILSERFSKIVSSGKIAINTPFIDKIRGVYVDKITIKLESDKKISAKKADIATISAQFLKEPHLKGYSISIDVDPQ